MLFASFLVFADTIERHFGTHLVIDSAAREAQKSRYWASCYAECKLPVLAGLISEADESTWQDLVTVARSSMLQAAQTHPADWVQAQLDLDTIFQNKTLLQLLYGSAAARLRARPPRPSTVFFTFSCVCVCLCVGL